jgi:hypothetical protein
MEERGRFLLEYIDLLAADCLGEPEGFRHVAARPGSSLDGSPAANGRSLRTSRERWVVNKVRALGSWYTKCLENGSRLRISINSAESIDELRDLIAAFFRSSWGRVLNQAPTGLCPTARPLSASASDGRPSRVNEIGVFVVSGADAIAQLRKVQLKNHDEFTRNTAFHPPWPSS